MTQTYDNVFDAIEKDPAMAQNLFIRSKLMIRLKKYIETNGLTQKSAAELMGVTQPRISDLVRGKIDRFTIDMLVNMLVRAGIKVDVNLKNAA
ncbi:MAG: XRE family transcriptional regulator [Deltaproteobacteria bacterium]|nr:XRE family transcriptional regulator [Deltaproteobacteria bacterium]MBW2011460.1 XRE family transcriptional regulator [Deltaproteobacteria bacterium]